MRLAFALTLLTASLLVSTLSSGTVRAQGKYPDRTVKIVVPYPAGGPTDIVARLLADRLGRGLGGNFIVENVAGASATLGARAVGAAAPDGYSLLLMTQDFLVQPLVKASVPYDPVKGFVPVSLVGLSPEGIYVNPSVPATSEDQRSVHPLSDSTPAGMQPLEFAFENYTALGYGNPLPGESRRLIGPITALNGLLLIGWSVAIIFEVMRMAEVQVGRLDDKDES